MLAPLALEFPVSSRHNGFLVLVTPRSTGPVGPVPGAERTIQVNDATAPPPSWSATYTVT
jgi:hypothetical protein